MVYLSLDSIGWTWVIALIAAPIHVPVVLVVGMILVINLDGLLSSSEAYPHSVHDNSAYPHSVHDNSAYPHSVHDNSAYPHSVHDNSLLHTNHCMGFLVRIWSHSILWRLSYLWEHLFLEYLIYHFFTRTLLSRRRSVATGFTLAISFPHSFSVLAPDDCLIFSVSHSFLNVMTSHHYW